MNTPSAVPRLQSGEVTRVYGSRSRVAPVVGHVAELEAETARLNAALATETELHAQTQSHYESELREAIRLEGINCQLAKQLQEILSLFTLLSAENLQLRRRLIGGVR